MAKSKTLNVSVYLRGCEVRNKKNRHTFNFKGVAKNRRLDRIREDIIRVGLLNLT